MVMGRRRCTRSLVRRPDDASFVSIEKLRLFFVLLSAPLFRIVDLLLYLALLICSGVPVCMYMCICMYCTCIPKPH